MKYSFIIPVKEINDYIRESVPRILEIKRDDFEVIIYPNEINSEQWDKTRQIASGPGGPAMKRNLAMRDAQGEILIFVDDDAYPEKDFLDVLDKDFADLEIVAVGGPAITPKDDNFWQKVSGAVFLSKFGGGNPERYVPVGSPRFVDDWPSVNLSMRKGIFAQLKGFDCEYWPGEDTKLCADLLKSGKKVWYNPELIAWHHRRSGLKAHLKQVGGYGFHRGFFAKKNQATSCRFLYFVPTSFLVFVVLGGVLSFFSDIALKLYLLGWLFYILALLKALFDIYKYEKNSLIAITCLPYIFLSHFVYGWLFLKGFVFTKELKSKLR